MNTGAYTSARTQSRKVAPRGSDAVVQGHALEVALGEVGAGKSSPSAEALLYLTPSYLSPDRKMKTRGMQLRQPDRAEPRRRDLRRFGRGAPRH